MHTVLARTAQAGAGDCALRALHGRVSGLARLQRLGHGITNEFAVALSIHPVLITSPAAHYSLAGTSLRQCAPS